jgi:hypothetical protein
MANSSTDSILLVDWQSVMLPHLTGMYLTIIYALRIPHPAAKRSVLFLRSRNLRPLTISSHFLAAFSEFTVGGTIAVSVDVSGNGKMPQDSYGPNSTSPTGFISLSIYLVSDNKNVTVVDGTTGSFLAGEVGSTVKHLNYVVPNCLSEGRYEVHSHSINIEL